MDNRLIFLYRSIGVMEGRSMLGDPSEWRFSSEMNDGRRSQDGRQANPLTIKSEDRKDHEPLASGIR